MNIKLNLPEGLCENPVNSVCDFYNDTLDNKFIHFFAVFFHGIMHVIYDIVGIAKS